MDQVKIGHFLKTLRKEKSLTQEQLAEQFGVSGRTVSRWENGNNMPDISILVELAEFYDTDIREILDGERKRENMDQQTKQVLDKVVDYTSEDKEKIIRETQKYTWAALGSMGLYGILAAFDFSDRFSMIRIGAFYCAFFCAVEVLLFTSGKAMEMRKNKKKTALYLIALLGVLTVIVVSIFALTGILSS